MEKDKSDQKLLLMVKLDYVHLHRYKKQLFWTLGLVVLSIVRGTRAKVPTSATRGWPRKRSLRKPGTRGEERRGGRRGHNGEGREGRREEKQKRYHTI